MSKAESLNVLLVDDNQNNLLSLHSLIDEYIDDVHVSEADSGIAALNTLMKNKVDLIILDLQMPEMDGFETAEIIRSRKKTRHIPIVFLTAAYKSEEFKQKGYDIGAADYLTKPIDTHQLINKIKTYLRFIQQERQHNLVKSDLEHKVQQNMTELLETNKRLQQEIVERKRIEEELKWALETAESANLAKSQFLANMSHELRTPLNVIIGYTEMLEEEALDLGYEACTPELEKICLAAKHLLTLINDVLDISKIEAGKMTLHCETFDLATVINQMTSTVEPLMEKHANTFQLHLEDALGEMYADPSKLRQILLNLISNAAKFTEKGTITLELTSTTENGNKWFNFNVTDTGIGMHAEQISHLFQLFSQVDSSSTRKYGGAGLGLAITKQFTEMMEGTISVESELGQGSTFIVRLPAECRSETPD
jgi:signal transduction histidine kinase